MFVSKITFPGKKEAYSLLLFRLAALMGLTCLLFAITDSIHHVFDFLPIYALGVCTSCLVMYITSLGKFEAAAIVMVLATNIFVYVFAAADDPDNGVYFFFIPCVLGSLVLFFPERKIPGILLASVSFALALIAYLVDWTVIPQPTLSEDLIKTNFVINFSLALLTSGLILVYMLNKNKDASDHLIEKNKELTKINHELDSFVYSASHDMRAPLTTLLGLIQIARHQKTETELNGIFEMMKNRIHALDGFLKNITEYSRNVHLPVNNKSVLLAELIESVCAENKLMADQENILFETQQSQDERVLIDPTRVQVILNNLVNNAIKYHDHHSDKDKWIKIISTCNKHDLTIRVIDNGVGIDDTYQPRIFDLFYRASEKSRGSGLGLYIVKETVHKLNGSISCVSKLGVGSEFIVNIPLTTKAAGEND